MAKLIGTAGHVDHGKTTLIRALTGIDADRLPEEKRRGLTIDIGFAHMAVPGHGDVSIVDVPGHERFVTNMLVGAMGMDIVLLCVAADEGVMPQTEEHFQVVQLLPCQSLVVVLTRRDASDDDTTGLVREQVAGLLAGTRFEGCPIVEVSAKTGEGLETLRQLIKDELDKPAPSHDGLWILPVDRVFTRPGHGTVVTGTLMRGKAKPGEACVVLPGGHKTKIKNLQAHGEQTSQAEFGQRTAVNLTGIDLEKVERGSVVCQPGAAFETTCLDAKLVWHKDPKHGARVRVSLGADEVIGKVFLNDNDPSLAQFRLERATVAATGQSLIVRQYSPPVVLGGGAVTVPEAKRRSKQAKVDGDAASLVGLVENSLGGLPTQEIARRLGLSESVLAQQFESEKTAGRLLGFAGLWFTPHSFDASSQQLLGALQGLHDSKPDRATLPREEVVKAAGLNWTGKPLDRIVTRLAEDGRLFVDGTLVRLPAHRATLPERQQVLLSRVVAMLDAAGVNVPNLNEIAEALHVPIHAVRDIVRVGWECGQLVRLDENIVYSTAFFDQLGASVAERYRGKRFTAAQFREDFATSRKYTIPILEHFDSRGITLRQGDERVVR